MRCSTPSRSIRTRCIRSTLRLRRKVAPFVCDTAALLNQALADGESVMFEGAQGTMLDIDHGTYPFVTSSSATSGGAVIGTGVAPTAIDTVIGVTKAYCTRVGGGPFPTEALDAQRRAAARAGQRIWRGDRDVRGAAAGWICRCCVTLA